MSCTWLLHHRQGSPGRAVIPRLGLNIASISDKDSLEIFLKIHKAMSQPPSVPSDILIVALLACSSRCVPKLATYGDHRTTELSKNFS